MRNSIEMGMDNERLDYYPFDSDDTENGTESDIENGTESDTESEVKML